MDQHFDIGIVGGGCAGLQLLHQLSQQKEWPTLKILLVDDNAGKSRPSWCFWAKSVHPLQHLISKSWEHLRFNSPEGISKQEPIAPYRYHYISGENFFNYFWQKMIPANVNITVVHDRVTQITKNPGGFLVQTKHENFAVKQCFSSIIPNDFEPASALWQHFKGWYIETDTAVFDDTTATLMDFSVPAADPNCFIYVLPFSGCRALIEATFFSGNIAPDQVYEGLIQKFISQNYPNIRYQILSEEKGQIPMSQQFGHCYGRAGEILIGTAAGMVKATSGYAFNRIGNDSRLLVQHFIYGKPDERMATKGRFRFYDTLFLRILKEQPDLMPLIFTCLFSKNAFKNVLLFLDEKTSPTQESAIFATLPLVPFIKQAIKYCLKKAADI